MASVKSCALAALVVGWRLRSPPMRPARRHGGQEVRRRQASGPVSSRQAPLRRVTCVVPPARPSASSPACIRRHDPLDLKSSVALVIDQDTREVLFSKNDSAVLPIASITKLMTGLVVSEAKLPMDEMITITQDDVDTEKGSSSRLRVGTELTRGEMLHLALMSSENRAANALGPHLSGRHACVCRGDERQGASSGHEATPATSNPRACPAATSRARMIWRCWSRRPTKIRCCANIPPRPSIRWRWASAPCSSATPTGW